METTDLVLRKSVTVSDAGVNGGRISYTQVTSNVLNNLFPNVMESERTNGVTRYRKFFMKNKNASLETASNSRIWISEKSTGGDYFRLKLGTNTDEQDDSTAYTNWVGTGNLTSSFAVDTTSFDAIFDTNNGVYNSSRIRIIDSSGVEEFLVVKSSNGVTWVGNTATIHVTTPARNTYPSGQNTLVSGVVDIGNLVASTDSWAETSASGTYDEDTYPVVVNNVGTVEDSWTVTFLTSSTFSVSGSVTGALENGSIGSNYSPTNANTGTGDYYFRILAAGWGGTWAIGETVTFNTNHSAGSVWCKEVVPAATAAKTNSTFKMKMYVEGS